MVTHPGWSRPMHYHLHVSQMANHITTRCCQYIDFIVFTANVVLMYRVFQKKVAPKTFCNIFTSVKSFCVKFVKFVGNSYPHTSANYCTFILIFHQMALIFPWVPIVFTMSSFEYWMQTLREQGFGEKAIISSYTLTKGESWALLKKSAVESTTLAQPFCRNQAVGLGDLPQRLHVQFVVVRQFSHW